MDPVTVFDLDPDDPLTVRGFGADRFLCSDLVTRHVREATTPVAFKGCFQGIWTDRDEVIVGGVGGTLYRSRDRGLTWTADPVKTGDGAPFLSSIVRHDGALWVGGWGTFLARRRDATETWETLDVPQTSPHGQAKLVVVNGHLYVLGKSIWRVTEKGLEAELSRDDAVTTHFLGLTETAEGSRIACGELGILWRKPKDGAWEDMTFDRDTYLAPIALGAELLLIGFAGSPRSLRASTDDGKTFHRVALEDAVGAELDRKKPLVTHFTRAIPDRHGGALVGGLDGLLIRVANDGLGPWAGARDRFADAEGFDSVNAPKVPLRGTAEDLRAFEEIWGVPPPPALRDALGPRATDVGLWPSTRQRNVMRRALESELAHATLAGCVARRDGELVEVATGDVVREDAPALRRSAWIAAGLARTFDLDAYEDLARDAEPQEMRDAATAADVLYGLYRAYFTSSSELERWIMLASDWPARVVHDAGAMVAAVVTGMDPRAQVLNDRVAKIAELERSPRSERLAARLAALEAKHGFTAREDHRAFLRRANATTMKCSPESAPPAPYAPERYAQVAEIYGVAELEKLYATELAFWHAKLLPHAYLVGVSFSGDPIVQVARGAHAGKVFMTNHETYFGMVDVLASPTRSTFAAMKEELGDILKKHRLTSLASVRSMTTDQLLDLLNDDDVDGNMWLADSFEAFVALARPQEPWQRAAQKPVDNT